MYRKSIVFCLTLSFVLFTVGGALAGTGVALVVAAALTVRMTRERSRPARAGSRADGSARPAEARLGA